MTGWRDATATGLNPGRDVGWQGEVKRKQPPGFAPAPRELTMSVSVLLLIVSAVTLLMHVFSLAFRRHDQPPDRVK